MPTRNITLTETQAAFIEGRIAAGQYQNKSEVVRQAIRDWQLKRRQSRREFDALQALIKEGIDDLNSGNYAEVDDADLDAYLENLDRD